MTAVDERATPGAEPGDEAPRPKVARYAALAVGVVLVLFIALLATRPSSVDEIRRNPLVGKRVPALRGHNLDGGTTSVDQYRGKWVLVNFVAEWCIGCKVEHPDLLAFAEANAADVQVIGVGFNDTPDKLRAFFEQEGGTWPVIVSDDGRAAIDFGVTAVPETFVVSPDGIVVAHAEGVTRQWLDDTLAQGKAALAQAQADVQQRSTANGGGQ